MKVARDTQVSEDVVFDTNIFIDASNGDSHAYSDAARLLRAVTEGQIRGYVSLHTLHELDSGISVYGSEARRLADSCHRLPYWLLGTIDELLGTIDGLSGTFDDARRNSQFEKEIRDLTNAGTDLHDRGALLDAIRASISFFVTSDSQLVKSGPASRIVKRFAIQPLSPKQAVTVFLEWQR